jgi:hypothetical protein
MGCTAGPEIGEVVFTKAIVYVTAWHAGYAYSVHSLDDLASLDETWQPLVSGVHQAPKIEQPKRRATPKLGLPIVDNGE